MTLDIDIEDWPGPGDWAKLAERARDAAGVVAPELSNPRLAASVLFTSDAEVRALNRTWRGKDSATNVLSFPMLNRSELLALESNGPPEMLGDIALAHETLAREAADKMIDIDKHAAHLLVHGFLHLAGHDHIEEAAAEVMEDLETKALALMGIGDPYELD